MLKSSQVLVKSFAEISKNQLYGILALRIEVFCVEQNCPYQDIDGLDRDAQHIFMQQDEKIIAYARILNLRQKTGRIGRVVVAKEYRNSGFAKQIMLASIRFCQQQKSMCHIEISAQSYLHDFYQNLGFNSLNKYYLEDDIPHEAMILKLT